MSGTAFEMHMARTGGVEVLQGREVALPPPGSGEARVTIEAAGVAFADIVMRTGLYPGVKAPVTPGYDFVGRIEALGPDVQGFSVGQRVAALTVTGSYASRRNIEARYLVAAPEDPPAEALVAGVLNGLTAWQMFHRVAGSAADEWVLVHGAAGGVGGLLLELARLSGVRAIGTASAGKKAEVEAKGGIHIDYRAEAVAERALAISGGGVVAAFDHVGGPHLKAASMAALRDGGTAVLYGGYDATKGGKAQPAAMLKMLLADRLSALKLFSSSRGVVGYNVTSWRNARPGPYREDLARVLSLIAEGAIQPKIAKVLPLSEAGEAQALLQSAKLAGKIVLKP
ncbi:MULTISPECIES: medium chain dehydrogenase/reductase family protein [unclassified Caulobacter]|uniref:medium chain dehydrogenase/reductase family protein n=1 Tax=unclassified Caulobacter TaxID=2648921 RepID=UPI0007819FF0|nr:MULTISPECIES: medium chain dehydrogenase/reductase family protein [unclassified Caulobacter]AZS20900.1 alcohol dehydrogenase [Caulobacter sp. FWC26]